MEGSIAVLMKMPYYLGVVICRIRCGHGDGILERNLFMLLRSVKIIAFLGALSILHIAVCMPLRWIASNCGNTSQHNFGVSDMASVVEKMDKGYCKVLIDRDKLIDE